MKIYSVASGKGGTGKTTFSVNLAITIANYLGSRVLVVDADFFLPSVNAILGIVPTHSLKEVLHAALRNLTPMITGTAYGIDVLSFVSDINESKDLSIDMVKRLVLAVSRLPYDIVIFDSGAGVSHTMLEISRHATDIIIVTLPDPVALLGSYRTMALINRYNPHGRFYYVVNRVTDRTTTLNYAENYVSLVRDKLGRDVIFLDTIPHDQNVMDAGVKQKPFAVMPHVKARRVLESIASRLIGFPQ
ncbi:MAG: P-loop NTPase [Spirochaetes bacterium]|nr:P-loop NTPase [Spirochaetota bacterium]